MGTDKKMNRAEATLALIAGKKVERVCDKTGLAQGLCWHPREGLCVGDIDDLWAVERDGSEGHTYREVWQPRTFLGLWEEVRTFEEAEPAGRTTFGVMAFFALVESNGDIYLETGGSDNCEWRGGCWVRRKPDAAKDDREIHRGWTVAIQERDAANERVKLLEGWLDEALQALSDSAMGTTSCRRLADRIREEARKVENVVG